MGKNKNESTVCICGEKMVRKVGMVSFVIKGKQIKVHNVPHLACLSCVEQIFDTEIGLASLIMNAYKKGLSEVTYCNGE